MLKPNKTNSNHIQKSFLFDYFYKNPPRSHFSHELVTTFEINLCRIDYKNKHKMVFKFACSNLWFCCFNFELCNILKRFFSSSEGTCKNRAMERWWILSRWWGLWLLWKLDVWYHQHESVQKGRKKGNKKKEKIGFIINFIFFPSVHIFLSKHEEIYCH